MSTDTLDRVARAVVAAFPKHSEPEQRVALALYRLLAKAQPATAEQISNFSGVSPGAVGEMIARWHGVQRDADGAVTAFWGLTLAKTTHRLRVNGRELHAWCAWDTLFLPALLGAKARVSSVCRGSGEPVQLVVGPGAVESAEPAGMMVSFLLPNAEAVRADLLTSFCHYVHFFRSPAAARPWLDEHPETFLLTVAEAYEVGRRRNRVQYSAIPDLV